MIFVTGTGRSGTSVVAQVIHASGIACMGHVFPPHDDYNVNGYYEEIYIRHKCQHFLLDGKHGRFEREVKWYHRNIWKCNHPVLGYKKPDLIDVRRGIWQAYKPLAVYVVTRSEEQVVKSLYDFVGRSGEQKWTWEQTQKVYQQRMKAIEKNLLGLPFVKVLDLSQPRSEEWILEEVVTHLAGLCPT
jgi:hypothetical protein